MKSSIFRIRVKPRINNKNKLNYNSYCHCNKAPTLSRGISRNSDPCFKNTFPKTTEIFTDIIKIGVKHLSDSNDYKISTVCPAKLERDNSFCDN